MDNPNTKRKDYIALITTVREIQIVSY